MANEQDRMPEILQKILRMVKDEGYIELSGYDGACLCAQFILYGVHVRTHCWKTCSRCRGSGVHVWIGDESPISNEPYKLPLKRIGNEVKRQLKKIYDEPGFPALIGVKLTSYYK